MGPNGSVLFTKVAVGVGGAAGRPVGTGGGVDGKPGGNATLGVREGVLVAMEDVGVDVGNAATVLVGLGGVVAVAVDEDVGTAVAVAVDEAVGTAVGVAVDEAVGTAVGVAVNVAVETAVDVAVNVAVETGVNVTANVAVDTGVDVGFDTDVDVAVTVAVDTKVDVAVELDDGIAVGVDVAVGTAVLDGTGDTLLVAVVAVFVEVATEVGVWLTVDVGVAPVDVTVAVAVSTTHGEKLGDFSGLRSGRACVLVSTRKAFARASTLATDSGPNDTVIWPPGGSTTSSTNSPPGTGTKSALPPRAGGMCCISRNGRLSLMVVCVLFEMATVPVTPSDPQPASMASIVKLDPGCGADPRAVDALATIAMPRASEMKPATKRPLLVGMTVRSPWRG